MRAALMFGPGDVRVEHRPDPRIVEQTDVVARILTAGICGSNLHPYRGMEPNPAGVSQGHEAIAVVEETGREVTSVKPGDVVVIPFNFGCGACAMCRAGRYTSCPRGGVYNSLGIDGLQAERARLRFADANVVVVPDVAADDVPGRLLPALLALTDVYLTGLHAATTAQAGPGRTVAVIGDGAVGLCAVLAARSLGAERIILMGRHTDRTDLGVRWGATDVVAERGIDGAAHVLELTDGQGADAVVDAVGHLPAFEQALAVTRPFGTISRVGIPQYEDTPGSVAQFRRNLTITGGVAPVRNYLDAALAQVLDGDLDPGAVFDLTVSLDEVPDAYRAMASRRSLKAMVRP